MIRILTDSASDILPAEAAQLGVDVIPLNVTLEDGTVTLRHRDSMEQHRVAIEEILPTVGKEVSMASLLHKIAEP